MLNPRRGVGFHSREAIENYTAAANKAWANSSSATVADDDAVIRWGGLRSDRQHRAGPAQPWESFAAPNQSDPNLPPHGQLARSTAVVGQILALTRTNDKRRCGGSAWAPLYCRLCRYRLLFEREVLHARTVEDAVDHKGQPLYPRVPAGPSRMAITPGHP